MKTPKSDLKRIVALLFYLEIEISIRIRFIFQGIMPPFLRIYLEAGDHGIAENIPVFLLFFGDQISSMVGDIAEEIKAASHIDFFAGILVHQRQVDGLPLE